MQFTGYSKVSLLNPTTKAPEFVRELPFGTVDTDTDVQDEFGQRLGVDVAINGKLSRLVKAAQLTPTAARSVNVTSRTEAGTGAMTLLCLVTIDGKQTELTYGLLDPNRDTGVEWMRRASDIEGFRSQLSEILALGAANPSHEIGVNLWFVTDAGATVP